MELTLSVCIPCIQSHVYLLDRCIKSIYLQTLLPNEVVISISSVNYLMEMQHQVEALIGKYRDKLNILIYYTSDKKYAGENRNKAIIHSTGDIISFIDADDLMYSNRLNTILTLFRVYPNYIGILHYFTENIIESIEPDQIFDTDYITDYIFTENIHFGHPSFRRSIFNKYLYTAAPRMQDLNFIESLLLEHIDNLKIYKASEL